MFNLNFVFAIVAMLLLPNCVAYMEAQARKEGLTGDPETSSFYRYDQSLADQKTAGMRQDLRNAQASLSARRAQIARLKSQLADLEARKSAATEHAVIEALDAEIKKTKKTIAVLEKAI